MSDQVYPPPLLLEDFFTVLEVDNQFEKVSRVRSHSHVHQLQCELDINTDIYPITVGERFSIALSLSLEYSKDQDVKIEELIAQPHTQGGQRYDPTVLSRPTLLNHYEYVMFGRVYGCDVEDASVSNEASVFISFGGLLMHLKGPKEVLKNIRLDLQVYLLMTRNESRL